MLRKTKQMAVIKKKSMYALYLKKMYKCYIQENFTETGIVMYKRQKKFDPAFKLPKHNHTRYCKHKIAVGTERVTSQWSSAKLLLLVYSHNHLVAVTHVRCNQDMCWLSQALNQLISVEKLKKLIVSVIFRTKSETKNTSIAFHQYTKKMSFFFK